MVLLVLFIAVTNLCLGFALAILLEERAPVDMVIQPASDEPAPQPEQPLAEAPPVEEEQPEETEEQPVEEGIPEEWLEMLEQENVAASSFVEASVQVLRLEVGRYRQRLIDIDDRVRECSTSPDDELIATLLVELKTANEDWMAQQSTAAGHLSSRQGDLGGFEEMGGGLEDVLMEQAAQIETTCSNIDHLDFKSDPAAGCQRLITEIRKLIDLAHNLRDRMQDSLLAIAKAGNQLDTLDKKLQFDGLTGIHNRSGLEVVFDELWRDDPNRKRQVSCAMIDIDRFSRMLEKHGAVACDKLLISFATLLADLVRKDRGFDMVARFAGQRFIAFFGDTGPRNATSSVERIRQSIEQSTFEWDEEELQLTVSCGVAELGADMATKNFFRRLEKTVYQAKKGGRNRTFMDEGDGPKPVDPPEYNVKPRIVRVSD